MSKEAIHAAVVDTSVFADYYFLYPRKPERHESARVVLSKLSSLGLPVYEPFLFEVELRALLVRRIKPKQVLKIVSIILEHVNVIRAELIHDKAAEVALLTGCRAVDAYYIATAMHVNAVLITNDKVMRNNALKTGIETYYLLSDNDHNTLINKLTTG